PLHRPSRPPLTRPSTPRRTTLTPAWRRAPQKCVPEATMSGRRGPGTRARCAEPLAQADAGDEPGGRVQEVEDGGDVGPHGADAEVELVGDLLVGGAGEHEADDATPARGELGERGGLRLAGIHGGDDGVPVRAGRGEAGGV